ncbi:hypothetical protein C7S16_2445 [Burkholderia thailandensis]|uniref:Uncharacterized protein n=1 Tax=Burkholderia thailandensis TaxID=57975 RepID=A0AAW9D5K6_BURTH|nr:hypothetical protein [Burkholderia thailandensis]MDW9257190.1 hypothetical protein [Burkholderia thailandensis]
MDKTLNSIKIRVETMACSHCFESGRHAARNAAYFTGSATANS